MIRDQLAASLRAALSTLEVMPLPDTVNLERPARREHGDWSSNVALATAKAGGLQPPRAGRQGRRDPQRRPPAPRHVGRDRRPRLRELPPRRLVAARRARRGASSRGADGYARPDVGAGAKVMVEFVSANPTGPLHAGHGRGAAYGDSLARVLERGRLRRLPRELPQRPRRADAEVRRVAGGPPDGRASRPTTATTGEYIADWAAEMPDGRRPVASGARPAPSRTTARPSPA